MEKQFNLTLEGQEAQQSDLNTLGETAALADDRVLWELLRLMPNQGSVDRAILPSGYKGNQRLTGLSTNALLQGGTNDRVLKVLPFRAIVGPIEIGTNLDAVRSIRSGYCVGQSDDLFSTVAIGINSDPSNARWTLVYAAVTPDLNDIPVSRFVKDATTNAVGSSSISVTKSTRVVLGMVDGAVSATPVRPAVPADAAGTYFIPLCYVWVPPSFGNTSSVAPGLIHEVAPIAPIHAALGVANCAPANGQWKIGGAVDTHQTPNVTTHRPHAYLPPTMVGVEERLIVLELEGVHPSHVDGDVIDDSIDWRKRFFQYQALANTSARLASATNSGGGDSVPGGGAIPGPDSLGAGPELVPNDGTFAIGMGQSFWDDTAGSITVADGNGLAMTLTGGDIPLSGTNRRNMPVLGSVSNQVAIYVRATDGALVLKRTVSLAQVVIFIWLRASGAYALYA